MPLRSGLRRNCSIVLVIFARKPRAQTSRVLAARTRCLRSGSSTLRPSESRAPERQRPSAAKALSSASIEVSRASSSRSTDSASASSVSSSTAVFSAACGSSTDCSCHRAARRRARTQLPRLSSAKRIRRRSVHRRACAASSQPLRAKKLQPHDCDPPNRSAGLPCFCHRGHVHEANAYPPWCITHNVRSYLRSRDVLWSRCRLPKVR